jgi:hypothetical protein
MNMVDGLVAVYVALGASAGRKRGLAEETYRLLRMSIALVAGCGLYSLVGDLLGKLISMGSDISGPVAFVGSMAGAWTLLRVLRAKLVNGVALRFHAYSELGGAIAGGLRNLVLALAGLITAHLSGHGGFMANSWLGAWIHWVLGN